LKMPEREKIGLRQNGVKTDDKKKRPWPPKKPSSLWRVGRNADLANPRETQNLGTGQGKKGFRWTFKPKAPFIGPKAKRNKKENSYESDKRTAWREKKKKSFEAKKKKKEKGKEGTGMGEVKKKGVLYETENFSRKDLVE